MKYLFSLAFILLIGVVPVSAAQFNGDTTNNQTYLVSFDKEGEATVAAQLHYFNATKNPLTEISFSLSASSVKVVRSIQEYTYETNEEYCQNYKYDYSSGQYNYDSKGQEICALKALRPITKHGTSILAAELTRSGSQATITIPLDKPVDSNTDTTITVLYKVTGYVTPKTFGGFTYNFQTPKFNESIDKVNVQISTNPELYLKGKGDSDISYVPSVLDGIENFSASSDVGMSYSGYSKSSYSNQQDTSIYKTATYLDPQETLNVSGFYASSWLRINYPIVLGLVLGAIIFIGVLWLGERRATHKN